MFDRDSAGMEGVRGAKHGARIRETTFQDAGTKDDGGRGDGRHSHSTEESPALRRARCRTVGRARSTPTVTGVRLKREPNLVHLR